MRRYRRIETIGLRNGLCFRNLRQPDHGLAVGSLGCPGLDWLPINGVKGSDEKRGKQGLDDIRIRAADKQGLRHGRKACKGASSRSRTETSASAKRARTE